METERPARSPELNPLNNLTEDGPAPLDRAAPPEFAPEPDHDLRWVFFGPEGLRAGWSVLIFIFLFLLVGQIFSLAVHKIVSATHTKLPNSSVTGNIIGEGLAVMALLIAMRVMALLEHRRVTDYNFGPCYRTRYFLGGIAAGFLALSALVGGMAAGGWLHFGRLALSGGQIFAYAGSWGVAFLLVGLMEEGSFRGYLQFTLTRGINFWWALAIVALLCAGVALRDKSEGAWGVYLMAVGGVVPCLLLELRKIPRNGFWQAAWATSTFFGFVHTGNHGESWIGIFAAGAIGLVFCVSIRVTGSAWWAIGCHASWDWAETYFYGTADSGLPAQGHLLTTTPTGSALWSGGANGPEGSLLVLPVILLLLIALLVIYGKRKTESAPAGTAVSPAV